MSTFGAISTAYSGLVAARAAMDVTGQNVANVGTAGYTRQRVDQAAIPGSAASGVFVTGLNIGAGVQVQGIARLNDTLLDTRARVTAAASGYWDVAATAAGEVESALNEPGTSGVSAALSDFWADWQDMGNHAGAGAQGSTLIEQGKLVASRIASGYTAASDAWSASRSATTATVAQVNDVAAQIAGLNTAILTGRAAGGSVNELMDRRDAALTTLARLTGATARPNADGTVDVVVDGNALVQGGSSRRLAVVGATTIADAAADPVRIVWADRPTVPATPDGGELAARVATLAGPNADGTGGTYAEAAKAYDTLATTIAAAVNAVHRTGSTPSGTTGVDFFSVGTTGPAALGLGVVPTSVAGIAAGNAAKGPADGSVADAIAQLGQGAGAPDAAWSAFVSRTAVATNALNAQATVAEQSSSAALTAQTSQSGVDLDEETSNLVVFQHAYQGAARVLTAVDEMLDTLINKTGLVGR